MDGHDAQSAGTCPVVHGATRSMRPRGRTNQDWWPNALNLGILHQRSDLSNPMGKAFDYAEAFNAPVTVH